MKFTTRFAAFLYLSALGGCDSLIVVNEARLIVDPPPALDLCEPGQDPNVDENLVAECTALTKPVGDWLLGVSELLEWNE